MEVSKEPNRSTWTPTRGTSPPRSEIKGRADWPAFSRSRSQAQSLGVAKFVRLSAGGDFPLIDLHHNPYGST